MSDTTRRGPDLDCGQTDGEEWDSAVEIAREHRAEMATVEISVKGLAAAADRLESDAALGAAIRAALAEVPRGEQLELYRCAAGEDRFLVHQSTLTEDDGETEATRTLAALLRTPTPEGPQA